MHDGTNDIIALEADEAFMARLSTPRGSNNVAQSETRRTGLAQVLTPTGGGGKKMRKRRDARSPASTTIAGTTSELCSVDVVTAVSASITAGRRASAMTFFLRHSQQPFEEAVGIKTRLTVQFGQRLACGRFQSPLACSMAPRCCAANRMRRAHQSG